MRIVHLVIFLLGFQAVYAHNPDVASLMIYEQNGKSILLIKSSLTAFEGEVDYLYGRESYKTPEAFNQLVVQHFRSNCFVIANGDTLTFSNVQVQLGHETNLFAELENVPKKIESFSIKNALFAGMHNNLCEVILSLNGFQQKQYILTNANNHEVKLNAEGNKWVVAKTIGTFSGIPNFLFGVVAFLIASTIFVVSKQRRFSTAT